MSEQYVRYTPQFVGGDVDSSASYIRYNPLAPGGRVAPDIPVTSGLQIQLAANTLTGLTDGQQVTNWTDNSGNGNNFSDAAAASGIPVYKTNILNGWPVVRCGPNRQGRQCVNNTSYSQVTISWVAKKTGSSADSPNDYSIALGKEGAYGLYFSNSDGTGLLSNNSANIPLGNMNDTSWHKYVLLVDDGVTNGSKLYFDGVLVGTGTFSIRDQIAPFTVGEVAGYSWNGDIAEMTVHNRILTTQEVTDMNDYFDEKYGV